MSHHVTSRHVTSTSLINVLIDCWAWAIGDGLCDDTNNNEKCDWDGLDCCKNTIYSNKFCNACICHLGNPTQVTIPVQIQGVSRLNV